MSGLSAAALTAREPGQWRKLLSVYAGANAGAGENDTPPMAGAYRVDSGVLVFEPQFPPEPGVTYTAVLAVEGTPERTARHTTPVQPAGPATVVAQVYPTADRLPENLLKFYVHFSAPMRRGHIYDHIRLLDAAGNAVELPFLELDEELWDPAMTRLTLFIDPGRIKRGVRPLEEIGPALQAGKRFTLAIDGAWRDAQGRPLKDGFRKEFDVGEPDREPPDPARWNVRPPKAGSREPLVVMFPEPLDHALARRLIRAVAPSGDAVAGEVALEDGERRWVFTPDAPWRRDDYSIVAQPTLEDLAGNNIGKPFEVDLENGNSSDVSRAVSVPVRVR